MSKKDRMKKPAMDKVAAAQRTRKNKILKLEKQIRKNPNDHVAVYNLELINAGEKGFAG